MTTLKLEYECLVEQVSFTHHSFTAHLNDGRTISVPITWYPRLLSSTVEELAQIFHKPSTTTADLAASQSLSLPDDLKVFQHSFARRSAERT